MVEVLARPGVVDAMIVAAIIVVCGVIAALGVAFVFHRFGQMSGTRQRR